MLPGLELVLLDVRQPAIDAALARLKGYADKALARGKMSDKAAQATLAGWLCSRYVWVTLSILWQVVDSPIRLTTRVSAFVMRAF